MLPDSMISQLFDFCFFKKSDINSTVAHIMSVRMEITPSKVVAPIGSQVLFTCKYWSLTASQLFISVDNLNVYDVNKTRFDEGDQLTYHHVVSSNQQTVTCFARNKNQFEVGRVNVLVSPGLNTKLLVYIKSLKNYAVHHIKF